MGSVLVIVYSAFPAFSPARAENGRTTGFPCHRGRWVLAGLRGSSRDTRLSVFAPWADGGQAGECDNKKTPFFARRTAPTSVRRHGPTAMKILPVRCQCGGTKRAPTNPPPLRPERGSPLKIQNRSAPSYGYEQSVVI